MSDEAAFLTRPDLPESFERWGIDVPPRSCRPTSPAEWAGALVRVDEGIVEVGCRAGGHETFRAGDLIALGCVPIVELRNHGDMPVRLVAVLRRGEPRSDPYLHVPRPTAEEDR